MWFLHMFSDEPGRQRAYAAVATYWLPTFLLVQHGITTVRLTISCHHLLASMMG